MDAGINLYSVRNKIKTEEDFLKTARELREMGYTYMQFSGGVYDPEIIARVSAESDLPVCLTHVPMDRIINDTDALMREHERFGCRNIGLGAMPTSIIADAEAFRQTVEKLNKAGEKMHENGFSFFYHHHHYEFYKHGGVTAFAYMIENAPHIHFTLDTYWVQYGGADILPLIRRLHGRIGCVHLKDHRIAWDPETKKFSPTFAPVGEGTLDFRKIVPEMRAAGTKYFLVEQDNAATLPDTMDEVRRSIAYVKTNL